MAIKIKLRRDTSLNWQTTNPVLDEGEPGFETDTLRFKIGNGSANWNSLNYVKFAGFINDIEGLDTANVEENVNLYFTNTRVYSNVTQIGYTSNAHLANALSLKANLAGLNTSLVSEGANLYFTNSRAVGAFSPSDKIVIDSNGYITVSVESILAEGNVASVNGETGVVTLTTANISENQNLYFTNERVYSNVATIKEFNGNGNNLVITANLESNNYVYIRDVPLRLGLFSTPFLQSLIPQEGQILYDASDKHFKGYNGTHWINLS